MSNISNEKLWEIVDKIVNCQKSAVTLDSSEELFVDWKEVEEDWFDYLKEKLKGDE